MFVVTIRFEFSLIPDLCVLKENEQLCCLLKNQRWRKNKGMRGKFKIRVQSKSYRSILAIIHFYDA